MKGTKEKETTMKTRDWKAIIQEATFSAPAAARAAMRIVVAICGHRVTIQQSHDGYVGLQVRLPDALNALDKTVVRQAAVDLGITVA